MTTLVFLNQAFSEKILVFPSPYTVSHLKTPIFQLINVLHLRHYGGKVKLQGSVGKIVRCISAKMLPGA